MTILRPSTVKLSAARGGPDTSLVTIRGIMGIFRDALEASQNVSWAQQVGMQIPGVDAESITHRWVGQTPGVRKWTGSILLNGLRVEGVTIVNDDYEDSIEISIHDLRRDKTTQLVMRISELAQRFTNHWEELLVTSLEANPTCYDGQAYFATTHSSGSSGTLSNLLSATDLPALNVSTAERPTREEAAAILVQAAAYFHTFKDDQGKKANQGARKFLVATNPALSVGYLQAVKHDLFFYGGSPLQKDLGWEFTVVPEPLLTSTTVAYMFRTDAAGAKPYIFQDEFAPEIKVIGPDSEHAIKNNSVIYSARATRGIGPGQWRHALKLTHS